VAGGTACKVGEDSSDASTAGRRASFATLSTDCSEASRVFIRPRVGLLVSYKPANTLEVRGASSAMDVNGLSGLTCPVDCRGMGVPTF